MVALSVLPIEDGNPGLGFTIRGTSAFGVRNWLRPSAFRPRIWPSAFGIGYSVFGPRHSALRIRPSAFGNPGRRKADHTPPQPGRKGSETQTARRTAAAAPINAVPARIMASSSGWLNGAKAVTSFSMAGVARGELSGRWSGADAPAATGPLKTNAIDTWSNFRRIPLHDTHSLHQVMCRSRMERFRRVRRPRGENVENPCFEVRTSLLIVGCAGV